MSHSNVSNSKTQLGYKESPCLINQHGHVEWNPSEILGTSCDLDVTYYPFDIQKCSVILSTWVSSTADINLDLDLDDLVINLERYSPSGTWELISTSMQEPEDNSDLSRVEYIFRLRRLSTFYVLNIIVPILLLSLTASAVFYLPAEAGEKIGMSMTVLLSFAVYLTIISDNMPQTSLQVSILSVYLTILLGICGLSVVASVFILHLHHARKDKKVGKKTAAVTRTLRKLLCKREKRTLTNNEEEGGGTGLRKTESLTDPLRRFEAKVATTKPAKKNGRVTPYDASSNDDSKMASSDVGSEWKEEKMNWTLVANTLDKVFFLSTSVCILVLTALVMAILVYGGNSSAD